MIPLIGAALVAAVLALYLEQRAERRAAAKLATLQQARIAEVLEELISLRSALVASGAAERAAKLPPSAHEGGSRPPPRALPALPSVERKVVSVTRDDDPIHTRATIEAPAPDGWGGPPHASPAPQPASAEDAGPPSTQPSTSRARRCERVSTESSPIFESKATVRARIEAAEDEREWARARGELPPLPPMAEDDNRPTGEVFGDDEQTRVFSKRPGDADAHIPGVSVRRKPAATMRPPPHAPPRPRSERPTLFDGMLRAPPVAPAAPPAPSSRTSMKTMPSAVAVAVRDAAERETEGGSA
jgi:hypothetical protein